jgi:coenzyme PQQ precursor peptide PqqA
LQPVAASGKMAGQGWPTAKNSVEGSMRKAWKKPRLVEIAVGLEINAYACAEL